MKIAIFFVAVLAFAHGASIEERSIFDIFDQVKAFIAKYDYHTLANQVLGQFGCKETEQMCETKYCKDVVDKLIDVTAHRHIDIITTIVCHSVCKNVQTLSLKYANGPIGGIDPCMTRR